MVREDSAGKCLIINADTLGDGLNARGVNIKRLPCAKGCAQEKSRLTAHHLLINKRCNITNGQMHTKREQ